MRVSRLDLRSDGWAAARAAFGQGAVHGVWSYKRDNAWVEGIGERLSPVKLPAAEFLVLKPPTGASTPKIFQSPALKRDSSCSTIEDFIASASVFNYGHNDLQPVAINLCPEIKIGLNWLENQNLSGRMTGSGSALFAPVSQASIVNITTLPPNWIAKSCKNLFEHPLKQWRK